MFAPFLLCLCVRFFGYGLQWRQTKNPPQKRGGHKPVSRGTTATAWFERHGTMGSTAAWVVFKLRWNGTQRRAQEVGNGGWMDWCLLALLANKNDPRTKTNILYRWNVFFSFRGMDRNVTQLENIQQVEFGSSKKNRVFSEMLRWESNSPTVASQKFASLTCWRSYIKVYVEETLFAVCDGLQFE